MIEDNLAQAGLLPDIHDELLAQAYEICPALHKSILKNAVSFTYAVAQRGPELVARTQILGHVREIVQSQPLSWAFFCVDLSRFSLPAIFSAMTLSLVAKVETIVVHVTGQVSDYFLFGCDLLSVDQIFTGSPQAILNVLSQDQKGVVIDLAGLNLDFAPTFCPDPLNYGVVMDLPQSAQVQAYLEVTAPVQVQGRPYISYGGQPESAPLVMAEEFLGCWVWDILSLHTFRHIRTTYS
jgi:hypothetical protein